MTAARSLRLLVMVDRRHPIDHSFLDGVLRRRLPAFGYRMLWVAQAAAELRATAVYRRGRGALLALPHRRGLHLGARADLLIGALRLIGRLRRWRPDIVYVRNEPLLGLVGLAVARLAGAPLVWQLSHFKEEEVLGEAAEAGGLRRWRLLLKGGAGRALRDFCLRRSAAVLAISAAMREDLIGRGLHPERIFVVPLGVEPGDAARGERGAAAEGASPYMIYIGTMAEVRRLDVTLDAFAQVAPRFPEWRLLMVGGGHTPDGRARLVGQAAALGLEGRVEFVPQVSRAEVQRYVRGARFGLSLMPPTRVLRTISPTKLMEYFLDAVPVLASAGIPEQDTIVRESGGGVLVAFEVQAVAEGMRVLMTDPGRGEMGRRGQAYILARRGYDEMAADLDRTLRSLLAA